MERFAGEIQRRLMAFDFSTNYVYISIGVLRGIFSIYSNKVPDQSNVSNNKMEIVVITLSVFSI